MEKSEKELKLLKRVLVVMFVISAIGIFIIDNFMGLYDLKYSTNCRQKQSTILTLVTVNEPNSKVNINSNYCDLCGESMSKDILLYKKVHCPKCKDVVKKGKYCTECGVEIIQSDYIPLEKVEIKYLQNFSNLRFLNNLSFILHILLILPVIVGLLWFWLENIPIDDDEDEKKKE